jgi:hypothetical protein
MLSDKDKKVEPGDGKANQPEQHEVKVLRTSKADNSRNPLHGDLSEKPEDENAAVRDQHTKK